MADENILNEIALNERKISHKEWGSFIIRRPTNRVLSKLDTVRTRSINKDLQQKDVVEDPITGDSQLVPAFLTRKRKETLLEEMGEWTQADRENLELLSNAYRTACLELDQTGFESTTDVVLRAQEILDNVKVILGDKVEDLQEELDTCFPMAAANPEELASFPDPVEGYAKARAKIVSTAQDLNISRLMDKHDNVHKQYGLLIKAIQAQTDMYMEKVREISLFSDTVESRADGRASIAKIHYCTYTTDGELRWKSVDDCEDSSPQMLSWLLSEVENFQTLDPNESIEENDNMQRFNFLSLFLVEKEDSDDSPETETSKEDGQSPEKEQISSTNPSATKKKK